MPAEYEHRPRRLFLDGVAQSDLDDENMYHESLVHPGMMAHPTGAKRVAIFGGGEGATLREVLKHKSVTEAVMVDLDKGVVDASRRALPTMNDCRGFGANNCFDDPRATVIIDDVVKYIARTFGADACVSDAPKFDVIILDLLDPEFLPEKGSFAELLYSKGFLDNLLCMLNDDGVFVGQLGETPAEDEILTSKWQHKLNILNNLQSGFTPLGLHVYGQHIPSFEGTWA